MPLERLDTFGVLSENSIERLSTILPAIDLIDIAVLNWTNEQCQLWHFDRMYCLV